MTSIACPGNYAQDDELALPLRRRPSYWTQTKHISKRCIFGLLPTYIHSVASHTKKDLHPTAYLDALRSCSLLASSSSPNQTTLTLTRTSHTRGHISFSWHRHGTARPCTPFGQASERFCSSWRSITIQHYRHRSTGASRSIWASCRSVCTACISSFWRVCSSRS